MRRTRQLGFTLIEMLIVVVILGILAAIAIPKFSGTKERTNLASMTRDLGNLAAAERTYFSAHHVYTSDQRALGFAPSEGVTVSIPVADSSRWSAVATHTSTSRACHIAGSAPAPGSAATDGAVRCDP
jgi:prepilin-type N-terminal cleavage/methylation domain-containing protein